MAFLYEKIEGIRENGNILVLPKYIQNSLNPSFELRPYQIQAFENFITYFEGGLRKKPAQVLFHMATGSGKTLIMAGLMLYLYKQGYRNFLFFVNLSNIVEKTKDNFNNRTSSKYLFADEIVIDGERIGIREVSNFQDSEPNSLNICFSTTQGLHTDMWFAKENSMTFDDFDSRKVVLISDEAHHLNVDTKKKMSAEESESYHSWEQTVQYIFNKNPENVLLEFTATCDLKNDAIKAAYESKIIFDYALNRFYQDRYSKDIITLRSDMPIMKRALQALVLSQYRLKIFQSHGLSVKPVILFKARSINESKEFMVAFLQTVQHLSASDIQHLSEEASSAVMQRAFAFFAGKQITFDMLAQELREDFSGQHCVSVNDDSDAAQKQILLNSLEDRDNPYRAIFEVKKLDEGWDVLNLFDIVRLYETRQSGKKVSAATISEAQLIGRGARYCPFVLDDEQPKFQRKYDDDIDNEMRVCEQLYYHCQNDHRYVAELHKALQEIGLDTDKAESCKLKLKASFRDNDMYKRGLVFLNRRETVSRKDVFGLQPSVRDNIYTHTVSPNTSNTDYIMAGTDDDNGSSAEMKTARMTIKEIAGINYAIVHKALMKYPVYKFNTLKSYFPNLKTMREFINSDSYLGAIKIFINHFDDSLRPIDMYNAVFVTVGKIANSLSDIEETYKGTEEFNAKMIHDVFKDKTVHYTDPHDGGIGKSQNDPSVPRDCRIDLSKEDWFAFEDNFGTSEEKAFVAYFRSYVAELRKIYSTVYLVRNERACCIYSFDGGERFEPDFVLFLQKPNTDGYEQIQIFIEPKGEQLLEKDKWKEDFLLQLKEKAIPVKMFVDDNKYKIWGMHFFNKEKRIKDFDQDMQTLI